MHKELDNVLTKFPLFRARVIELFNNSHEFRSLCEDYLLCRDKLSQVEWESQKIQATGRQVTELSHKLEAEMMKYLRPLHD